MKIVKKFIKRTLQQIAARLGPQNRAPASPQLLILMYHRILPEEDDRTRLEEPGMIVSPETFKRNLETLLDYFEFVHLSDWLNRKQQGLSLPEKACAITFDDGWIDNYEFAFPVLKSLNVPATIFLVAEMIGSADKFWPERVALLVTHLAEHHPDLWSSPGLHWITEARTSYRFSATSPSREQLSEIIAHCKQYSDTEVHNRIDMTYRKLGLQEPQTSPSLLTWEQAHKMSESGLVDFGSHTCRHIRLGLDIEEPLLVKEVLQSQHLIENKAGQNTDTFCFPNGDYCPASLALVKQAYAGAVTTESGWNSLHSDPHKLKRIGIHEDIAKDDIAFRARLSGWI